MQKPSFLKQPQHKGQTPKDRRRDQNSKNSNTSRYFTSVFLAIKLYKPVEIFHYLNRIPGLQFIISTQPQ